MQTQALSVELALAVAAGDFARHHVPPVLALDDGVGGQNHIRTCQLCGCRRSLRAVVNNDLCKVHSVIEHNQIFETALKRLITPAPIARVLLPTSRSDTPQELNPIYIWRHS